MLYTKILWGILAVTFVVGLIGLSMWGIPAPRAMVEKVIPQEKWGK